MMVSMLRMVCPVAGCELWKGRERPLGRGGSVDQDGLDEHLALEHPDVDVASLWSTYEVTPGAVVWPERRAFARWLLHVGIVAATTVLLLKVLGWALP